jgi:hypothetical protein
VFFAIPEEERAPRRLRENGCGLPTGVGFADAGGPPNAGTQDTGRQSVRRKWFTYPIIALMMFAVMGQDDSGCSTETSDPAQDSGEAEKPATKEKPAEAEKPELTSGQVNALESAENYLDIGGMSKAGLIQQLSSPAGDDFSKADATFAANNVDADFKKEAVESAQNYLDISPMSKNALIEQLSSAAGDKFTPAQARYAANKVY